MGKRSKIHRQNVIAGIEEPYTGPKRGHVVVSVQDIIKWNFPDLTDDAVLLLKEDGKPDIRMNLRQAEDFFTQKRIEKDLEKVNILGLQPLTKKILEKYPEISEKLYKE